ncbi:MAG: hypothetical protein LC733_12235 [Actinobacteria bacterium]|nr:hypothetical protein [Actinomycetota bacterium]
MADLTSADRVVALLEWGDVVEADAAIDTIDVDGPDGWRAMLWRGTRALMEGRFPTCERHLAQAVELGDRAGEPRAAVLATLLLVALRREQQRPAEAEIVLRGLFDQHPSAPAGAHALLAAVIGEMGRDGQARQELSRLLPREPVPATGRLGALFQLADLAAQLNAHEEIDLLYRRLLPHARDFAVEEGGSAFYGAASLALGRLAQAQGRRDTAVTHFEEAAAAHSGIGAPLLLAHTHRHLASLLRTRGQEGDWERAVDLLDAAAAIYRQLGVDALAAETQAVLARSEDGLGPSSPRPGDGPILFRRQGDGWIVGPESDVVRLRDAQGLKDIARLLAAPRHSIHVTELLAGPGTGLRGPPGSGVDNVAGGPAGGPGGAGADDILDARTRAEYEARLTDLAGELVEAERLGNAVRAALARAERDGLLTALVEGEMGDSLDRARRVIGTRIRISLDRIERAQPGLGRHLRTAIRTGTFCSYEPDRPVKWSL